MNTRIKTKSILFGVLFSLISCPYFFMGAMNRPPAAATETITPPAKRVSAITEADVADVTAKLKSLALAAPEGRPAAPEADVKKEIREEIKAAAAGTRAACEYPAILAKYVASLPKISNDEAPLPKKIVNFLCKFCSNYVISGEDVLMSKVEAFMTERKPIQLLIVSFAVKSCNPGKVLAPALDFAEYVGLFTLDYMCRQIQSVYPPGAEMLIFSREEQTRSANVITQRALGLDVFPEEQRAFYQHQLRQLVHTAGFTSLKIGDFDAIDRLYETEEQREKELGKEPDPRELRGLQTFWRSDLDWDDFVNAAKTREPRSYRRYLNNVADEVARCLLIGSMATRKVVQKCVVDYPSYIRLSVRADEDGDVSSKLGINLVYGSSGSPSHTVLVIDQSQKACLLSRSEIDKQEERGHIYVKKICKVGDLNLAYMQWNGFEPEF